MQGFWPVGELPEPFDRVTGDSVGKGSDAPLAGLQLDLLAFFGVTTEAFQPSIFLARGVFGVLWGSRAR